MLDDLLYKTVIGGLVLALVAIVAYAIWDAFQPTFSLKKSNWVCTSSHHETTWILSGKVMVPIDSLVCDNWKRK